MWSHENRARYDRSRLRYPSDLTDAEWAHYAYRCRGRAGFPHSSF
jgi:hypothetical protein